MHRITWRGSGPVFGLWKGLGPVFGLSRGGLLLWKAKDRHCADRSKLRSFRKVRIEMDQRK